MATKCNKSDMEDNLSSLPITDINKLSGMQKLLQVPVSEQTGVSFPGSEFNQGDPIVSFRISKEKKDLINQYARLLKKSKKALIEEGIEFIAKKYKPKINLK